MTGFLLFVWFIDPHQLSSLGVKLILLGPFLSFFKEELKESSFYLDAYIRSNFTV